MLRWGLVAALSLALPGVAAAQAAKRCPAQLPAPVAAKRDAIVAAVTAAASTGDWTALGKLAGPGEFTYSFGDEGDPVAYWRQSVQDGIDIPRYLAGVLAMPCIVSYEDDRRQYWWPAAVEFDWKDLGAAERQALERLYAGKVDDWYIEGRATGYYVGWRVSIEADGAWSAFVAGD